MGRGESRSASSYILNQYNTPLEGEPYYRSSGMIYAVDGNDVRYATCQVDLERFDEEKFQYVFSPIWSLIDALPARIFQGIPGLDLDLRLPRYYRVNMTPVFISERTPGEGREDLWELLDAVGLDYYDRFEWLLRTNMRCGTDNLIVQRKEETGRVIHYTMQNPNIPADLQEADCVEFLSLDQVAGSNRRMRYYLIRMLGSGASIRLTEEKRILSDVECGAMLKLLLTQENLDRNNLKEAQRNGIERAKEAGKYKGRKKIPIDANLLAQVAAQFRTHQITEGEAMMRLGIRSRSTFYRRLREVEGTPLTLEKGQST